MKCTQILKHTHTHIYIYIYIYIIHAALYIFLSFIYFIYFLYLLNCDLKYDNGQEKLNLKEKILTKKIWSERGI